ncbi:uncharacterized protein K452DRAFT_313397 [Aplosporella prunicola CBS 121167]|uniref:Palmitoyltransferase n=1 Tax=Aplosporella prunicola CBS 121167 TaxID=1176127 RepID=A0A6A6B0F3_9PEZI|nr:uncharacterized protein K452DRAFT_313397 [Aplosporella prunicola CBS 121167]KAF2136191.1 hypothetical protein K452DRAFT_313397 [Aplosporella prunicola CBS 121167]
MTSRFVAAATWLGYCFPPLLPLAQLILPIYFISYRWGWARSLWTCGDYGVAPFAVGSCSPVLGWVLLLVPTILGVLRVYPWYWTVVMGGIWARRLRLEEFPGGRWCRFCRTYRHPRTTHCPVLDRCLPLYDHYCHFFPGPVYGDSQKSYLLAIAALPFHCLFCLGVALWMAIDKRMRETKTISYAVVMAVSMPCLIYDIYMIVVMWGDVVFCNFRAWEDKGVFYISEQGQLERVPYEPSSEHPYNMGWRENLRLNLGPV